MPTPILTEMNKINQLTNPMILLLSIFFFCFNKGIAQDHLLNNQYYSPTNNLFDYQKIGATLYSPISLYLFPLTNIQMKIDPSKHFIYDPFRSNYFHHEAQIINKKINHTFSDSLQKTEKLYHPEVQFNSHLIDLGEMNLYQKEKIFSPKSHGKIIVISLGLLTLSTGIFSYEYMGKADQYYDIYLKSTNPEEMNRYFELSEKYDRKAGYGLAGFQISFLITVYSFIRSLPQ